MWTGCFKQFGFLSLLSVSQQMIGLFFCLELEYINTGPMRAVHCYRNKYIILKYFDMKLDSKAKLSTILMGGHWGNITVIEIQNREILAYSKWCNLSGIAEDDAPGNLILPYQDMSIAIQCKRALIKHLPTLFLSFQDISQSSSAVFRCHLPLFN